MFEVEARGKESLDTFIQSYSSWHRFLKGVVWLMRYVRFVRHQGREICGDLEDGSDLSDAVGAGTRFVTVDELESAQIKLIGYVQRQSFPEEVACLTKQKTALVKKSSRLSKLSPLESAEE